MMSREKKVATEEESGVLCSGKRFKPTEKRIVAEREGQQSEAK